jgi:hypothetical protein
VPAIPGSTCPAGRVTDRVPALLPVRAAVLRRRQGRRGSRRQAGPRFRARGAGPVHVRGRRRTAPLHLPVVDLAAAARRAAGVRLRVAGVRHRRIPGRHRRTPRPRRGPAQHPAMAGKRRLTAGSLPLTAADRKRAVEARPGPAGCSEPRIANDPCGGRRSEGPPIVTWALPGPAVPVRPQHALLPDKPDSPHRRPARPHARCRWPFTRASQHAPRPAHVPWVRASRNALRTA